MQKILQKEEKVLRQVAKEVPIKDINTPKIKKVLEEMISALKSQNDGVAIAAPQIGHSLRIFVVAGKIFTKDFMKEREDRISGKKGIGEINTEEKIPKNLIFINPKISKLSRDKKWVPEGCLSVRWLYGKTHRSNKATVEAYDENGKKFVRGSSGLLAQIFQHETDHLNGILFHDHAKDLKEEAPQ
ncbi:MAG: peptide deformylase [Candidatus Nomurabacteria bacterium]|nr:peptide deformylase [Candidatus Nomurabacteria bacterium]